HPDGATRLIVEYAARHRIPFSVVPCCSDDGSPYKTWMKSLRRWPGGSASPSRKPSCRWTAARARSSGRPSCRALDGPGALLDHVLLKFSINKTFLPAALLLLPLLAGPARAGDAWDSAPADPPRLLVLLL